MELMKLTKSERETLKAVYGKDQAGKNVSVTGSIQVTFGDFADPT